MSSLKDKGSIKKNRIALGQAVKDGLIEEGASPYLKKGYRISQMNTLGMRYTAELESALERQKLYTTDDPARIEKFIAKFQEDFMNKNGMADFAAHEVAQYFGTTAAKGNEVFRTAWREKHVSWQREQNYLAFQKEVAETTIGLFKPDMSIEERKTAMDSFAKWLEGRAQTASIDGMKNAQVLDTILTGVGIAVEQSGDTDVLDVFKQTKFGTAAAASSLKVQAKILDIEANAIRLEEARARREEKELNDAFEAARATTRSISETYYAEPTEQNRLALEDAISTLMATPDDANTSLGIALRKELDAYDKAFVSGGNNKTPQTELRIDASLQKAKTYEEAASIIQQASNLGELTPADVTAKLSLWRTNFDPALDEASPLTLIHQVQKKVVCSRNCKMSFEVMTMTFPQHEADERLKKALNSGNKSALEYSCLSTRTDANQGRLNETKLLSTSANKYSTDCKPKVYSMRFRNNGKRYYIVKQWVIRQS